MGTVTVPFSGAIPFTIAMALLAIAARGGDKRKTPREAGLRLLANLPKVQAKVVPVHFRQKPVAHDASFAPALSGRQSRFEIVAKLAGCGRRHGDDGLLRASQVGQLKLNADFVMLSACNTAAPDGKPGAEGLSGLAKAFFYAGVRSLLVSHWPVDSDATVKLTTGLFRAIAADPSIGRAEALRRSTLAPIDEAPDNSDAAHPVIWAPFVLAGEGGANS
jgi:hypothetical protein